MTASGAVYPGSNPGGAIMKLLLELRDEGVGLIPEKTKMKQRIAARAVLLKGSKIALLHVAKHNYHKLPGGGTEGSETIEETLFREILEETGCRIKITGELGKIIEHRTHFGIVQTSYCFIAAVTKEGKPKFDEGEIEDGFELQWVTIEDAVKLLKKEKPKTYDGKFIVVRDLKFIDEAHNFIN
jgi:8-oxo-dGTP diphosphatase